MYELALFAGAGGGILGSMLGGHTCIGAVEFAEYPRKVLLARQKDGFLPKFPIWDDVSTFRIDNEECREYIQLLRSKADELCISGGFPCQDISSAGKGAGITADTRSGLWFEMARIIDEIRPRNVFVENSPMLTSRGLGIVLGDLAEMGYNAKWGVLGAGHVNASHSRERIWLLASNANLLNGERNTKQEVQREFRMQRDTSSRSVASFAEMSSVFEPKLERKCNGIPNQMDRLRATGNAQFPGVVRTILEMFKGE